MSRVLRVYDHATFREPLPFMFDQEPGFEVVEQAGSLEEARGALEDIDFAAVDLDLPDGDGTELIGLLHAFNSRCLVMVLTASADREAHARAVEAGAAGVLHKSVRVGEVVQAAHRLVAGESLLSAKEVVDLLRLAAGAGNATVRRSAPSSGSPL